MRTPITGRTSRASSSAARSWPTGSSTPPSCARRSGRRCRPDCRREEDAPMNLAALLFDVARRLPDRPAVSDGGNAWNYRELSERVARIAGGLRARGLQPGDRVLLCLENCGEFFELLFGCWAAGLCAVPANARLHPREVEYVAGNSGARLLIATQGLVEGLAPLEASVDSLEQVMSTRTAGYDALFAA